MEKYRVHTELQTHGEAEIFKQYLSLKGIDYETSDAGYGLTHFVVDATEEQIVEANKFIDTL